MNLAAIARLAPGATPAAAQAEIGAFGTRRFKELGFPDGRLAYTIGRLEDQAARPVRRGLLVLLGAVGFVLLIACTNVANLLIARTGAREREFAVRAALGAGSLQDRPPARHREHRSRVRWRGRRCDDRGVGLARDAGAGARAACLAPMTSASTFAWSASRVPLPILAGIAFGIASALHIARQSVAATLQSAGTRLTGNARQRFGRRLIVAAEVALSVVLLVGAGLLAGSFARLQHVTPGFDARGVLTGNVLLPVGARFDPVRDGPRWSRFFDQFTARLDALPGVSDAGAVSSLPLSGAVESGGFTIEGRADAGAG